MMRGMSESAQSQPAVCLLIGTFHPRVGGGETHARLLSHELKALGTPIFVLTRRHESSLPAHDQVDGVEIRRVGPAGFPRFGKYLMIPAAIRALSKARADYDIIYVCGLRVLGIAGVLAGRWFNKRIILRSEACGEWSGGFFFAGAGNSTRKLNPLLRAALALRNRLYRKADRFLAISRVIRDEFLDGGLRDSQIVTITNGINFDAFQPATAERRAALREEFAFGDSFVFAYSGKLNRGKGLEMLLRVWRGVATQHPSARLLLIGAGGTQFLSCEQELRSFVVANSLQNSVIFTGYTNRVADYLSASDAFVFPSESESLGLALIEAMACGLPSLASATGGILDIVTDQEDGRLLPVGDENAWQKAMIELMQAPEMAARWAAAGAASVRKKFAIREIAIQHQHLFRSLLTK